MDTALQVCPNQCCAETKYRLCFPTDTAFSNAVQEVIGLLFPLRGCIAGS